VFEGDVLAGWSEPVRRSLKGSPSEPQREAAGMRQANRSFSPMDSRAAYPLAEQQTDEEVLDL